MNIALLLGTARKGNVSREIFKFVSKALKEHGLSVLEVKPEDHLKDTLTARSGVERPKTEWSKIMESSSGLVIVSPEYNHGYPGELKLMLDELYDEYLGKPVLVCGVSDGELGGARMVENLLPVLTTLGLYPLRRGVYFSNADKLIDGKANINDPMKQQLDKSIEKFKEYLNRLSKT